MINYYSETVWNIRNRIEITAAERIKENIRLQIIGGMSGSWKKYGVLIQVFING